MEISRDAGELEVFAVTLYAEARDQPDEGIRWVGWVIKNRVQLDRPYWYRDENNIKNVCLCPTQFECWNGRQAIEILEREAWVKCLKIAENVLQENLDPTGGCDHYNNPAKEGYPDWTQNCTRIRKIKDHQFYKSI
jgi:spore germination cell wall hydrolase CwlJ-like protein